MANLPANPGEALWIGGVPGKNFYNIGIGQGTSGGSNHIDYGMDLIEDGASPPGDPNKFFLSAEGNPVFRINASAGRTSANTAHPRCELRELTQGGAKAAWDGRSGKHTVKGRSRIIQVTSNRPWICFFQAHGSDTSPNTSDLFRVQTEGTTGTSTNLSIVCRRTPPAGGDEIRTVLKTGYNVGQWVSWEAWIGGDSSADNGRLRIWLDGVEVLNVTGMGMVATYWKMGCYLQDNIEKGALSSDWGAVEVERGSFQTMHPGYTAPTTPVFTGGTDPGGGAGGGAGNDTQAPAVPQNLVGVRGNNQAALSWSASSDNVGVDHYNVYRFSASGSAGGDGTVSVLGNNVGGAGETLSSADKMVASRFTATAGGKLTAGHFRAYLSATGSTLSKMVIYADSSGSPGSRLAVSDEITISSTAEGVRDYAFTGANQITITAGTAYWVAAAWDDPGTPSLTFSRGAASLGRVESAATYGTPPNPFGTVAGTFTGPIDAWCDVVAGTGAGTGGGGTLTSLGKTSDGASNSASSADKTAVSSAVAAASGTLVAGHARVWVTAGTAVTKCVIYANSSGAPGARLATSNPVTISNTTEARIDYTFTGADQIALTSGTTYWVGLAWQDPGAGSVTLSRDATASARQEASVYAPDPFGTPTALTGPIDVYLETTSGTGGTASGSYVLLTTRTVTNYTNTGLTNGTAYTYAVSAEDAAGNESALSSPVVVTPGPPDTTAPTVPGSVAATAGDGRITVTWAASTDADAGMSHYLVYFDSVQVGNVPSNSTTATALTVVGLSNGHTYSVQVSAVDRSLNESAKSSAVTATPAAPSIAGTSLLPGRLSGGKVEVAIAWGADLTANESTWTWTDITDDVRAEPGISCALGRNDESSTSNPASLTLVLDNSSGDYSLGGRSANWPNVRRNTPVRVRVDPGDGGGGRIVLVAFADGFTPDWDSLTGNIPIVTLSASGTLRRLAQGDAPVTGTYRRVMSALSSVKAYWPLEEGKSATYAPALRGGSDFTFTGGFPNWEADSSSFDCASALPTIGKAYGNATVAAYSNTGASQVRFLLAVPDGGLTDGTVLARFGMTGTIGRWDLTYAVVNGVEALGLYRYNSSGGTLHSSDLMAFQAAGKPSRFSIDWTQSGSDIVWTVSLTPAEFDATGIFVQRTLTGKTSGIVNRIEINPNNADIGATIGHITVENAVTSLFAENDALIANAGEFATTAGSRLVRLCRENSIPLQRYIVSGQTGGLETMGPQLVAPLLQLLHECEAVDQGQLWDGRNAGLSYTSRRRREQGLVSMTIDASAGELAGDFAPVDDDQRNRNRVTVTRLHGITITEEDATGPLGTGEIGIYDDAVTINNNNDSMAGQYAHWFVALGTVEGYRYPSVTVDLAAAPQLAGQVLDLIPGSRVDIVGLDTTLAQFPDDTVSLIVEGIAHEISKHSWRVTLRCSAFSPWRIGTVAAATGDTSDMCLRLDTDGASLASSAAAGATSISVASTGVRWTTAADDYPLYLSVGGIKVRATACSGASSPQTFTVGALPVARASGLPVKLWDPPRIGLG